MQEAKARPATHANRAKADISCLKRRPPRGNRPRGYLTRRTNLAAEFPGVPPPIPAA